MRADRVDSCDDGGCALGLASFGACSTLRAFSGRECVKCCEHLTGVMVKPGRLKLAHKSAKISEKSLIKV